MKRNWHTWWVLLGWSVVVCGCGPRKPAGNAAQEAATQTVVYQNLDPGQVVDAIEKRYYLLKNFSSQPIQATVTSRLVPFGKQELSGSLVVEKPNKLRLSIAKHHSPIRVDAICDGKAFWVIHHEQKSIYAGLLGEPLNSKGRGLVFNPVDIFNALFCVELTRDANFEYRITYVEVPTPGYYVIVVLNSDYPNKLYSKIWVNRTTLQIERHQLFKPEVGEVKVDAVFADFVENTPYDIPHKISLTWPEGSTTLALDLKGLRVNRKFENPNIFTYDRADKGYGEIRVTGVEPPAAGRGLQERDATRGGAAAPRPQGPPGMEGRSGVTVPQGRR